MMLPLVAHTLRADLRERLRRPAFLVVVALTALASFAFAPPADASYAVIDLGGFRGADSAAWLGAMLTMLLTQFVGLLGFFYVRGPIAYDISSGVGQILGATPLGRPAYLLGKWLSSWAILALLTAIVGLMGGLLLLARSAGDLRNLPGLLLPLLVIALPSMGLVAGIATLFDAVRPLRGTAGSVVYFTFFVSGLIGGAVLAADPAGLGALTPSITAACAAVYGDACAAQLSVGLVFNAGPAQTFPWPGMAWTLHVVLGQWLWAGVGLGLALAGALLFDGFVARPRRVSAARADTPAETAPAQAARPAQPAALTAARPAGYSFGRVLLAELRLLLKGRAWWWYAGALGLIGASALNPAAISGPWLLPLAWAWPLRPLAELGTRARRFGVAALLDSAPQATLRQLPATWLAGALLMLALGGGAALSLGAAGAGLAILGMAVTALLIPALALALGSWSGSPRLFEIVYLLLWYGALNGLPALAGASADPGQIAARALLTAGLLVAASLAPRRRP